MATEKRLIDATDWDSFYKDMGDSRNTRDSYDMGYTDALDNVDDWIDAQPTVDAVEVVHSQWDTVFYERNSTLASYSHLCPECKYFYRDVRFKGHNYCPNCGAKMDGERKGNGRIY